MVVVRLGSARASRKDRSTGELISQMVARHPGMVWNPIECICGGEGGEGGVGLGEQRVCGKCGKEACGQ